ncbi:uncharacterized protein LOC116213504 [Punica granatum]|uniref:Uncharacterized protein LOC116213504 n=2 Tax=Punica granatum TaxID=22663 RepID=A0A6P8EFY0_PUNGR|nr:uncharacterized protein LOC116213504 [Punica granatum]PKI53288.1 hypothetical protein CRG98_026316 [Punica granatum]
MEGSSSAQPSASSPAASKLLANLPSRGLFSSTVLSSNPGGMRVYVCEHDTSPPDGQLIKTNQQNILIRSLMLRKQRGESTSKNGKGVTTGEGSRKRTSERLLDNGASAKRPSNQASSRQDGSNAKIADRDLHTLTVERLRALLKERGLSPRGKKDELISRLKNGTS